MQEQKSTYSVIIQSRTLASLFGISKDELLDDQLTRVITLYYAAVKVLPLCTDFDTSGKFEVQEFCFRQPITLLGESRITTKEVAIGIVLDSLFNENPSVKTSRRKNVGSWSNTGTPWVHFITWKAGNLKKLMATFAPRCNPDCTDFNVAVFKKSISSTSLLCCVHEVQMSDLEFQSVHCMSNIIQLHVSTCLRVASTVVPGASICKLDPYVGLSDSMTIITQIRNTAYHRDLGSISGMTEDEVLSTYLLFQDNAQLDIISRSNIPQDTWTCFHSFFRNVNHTIDKSDGKNLIGEIKKQFLKHLKSPETPQDELWEFCRNMVTFCRKTYTANGLDISIFGQLDQWTKDELLQFVMLPSHAPILAGAENRANKEAQQTEIQQLWTFVCTEYAICVNFIAKTKTKNSPKLLHVRANMSPRLSQYVAFYNTIDPLQQFTPQDGNIWVMTDLGKMDIFFSRCASDFCMNKDTLIGSITTDVNSTEYLTLCGT